MAVLRGLVPLALRHGLNYAPGWKENNRSIRTITVSALATIETILIGKPRKVQNKIDTNVNLD
jgi:hypothetical protein